MTYSSHREAVQIAITDALRRGIDKTTSQGTIEAKQLVHVEFAVLQGSIKPEPAQVLADGTVAGSYGSHAVDYAVYQEFLPGEWMPAPDGAGESLRTRRGGKPYMRPSEKVAAEKLLPNIAAAWRR